MRHLIALAALIGCAGAACQGSGRGTGAQNNGSQDGGSDPNLCNSCQNDQECGDGNYCLPDPGGGRTCGTSCSSDNDCPDGYWCNDVNDSNGQRIGGACRPQNWGSCNGHKPQSSDASNNNNDGGVNPGNPDAAGGQPDAGMQGPLDTGFVPCTGDTWSNYAQSMFSANCTRCHATYTNLKSVEADGVAIRSDIQSGRMPKDRMMQANDIMRATRWIDCDMPP
jgi:hypothetical protein